MAMVTYPDVSPQPESAVVERSYSAHQISDGTFLKDLMDVDVHSTSSFHHLIKLFLWNPLFIPITFSSWKDNLSSNFCSHWVSTYSRED